MDHSRCGLNACSTIYNYKSIQNNAGLQGNWVSNVIYCYCYCYCIINFCSMSIAIETITSITRRKTVKSELYMKIRKQV